MTIDQLLRSYAPAESELRQQTERLRSTVLQGMDQPTVRRRRTSRWRYAAAGAAGAVVFGGGVAYASGLVPDFVREATDRWQRSTGDPALSSTLHQTVDLTLPDGSHFAAWSAITDQTWCTSYVDNWDGRTQPGAPGFGAAGCGEADNLDANRVLVVVAAGKIDPTGQGADDISFPNQWFPVLFGSTVTEATQVHVSGTLNWTGEPVDVTLPIDPETDSFATTLPGGWQGRQWPLQGNLKAEPEGPSGLTLTFLDAQGRAVATQTVG